LDSEFHKAYLNRATCHIKIGDFDQAQKDINIIFDLIARIPETDRQDSFYLRILTKAYAKYYAVTAIKGEFDEALSYIDKIFDNKLLLDEKFLATIQIDRQMIEKRRDNAIKKVKLNLKK